jgi:hypothetical protein
MRHRINMRAANISGWSLVDERRGTDAVPNLESRNFGITLAPALRTRRAQRWSKIVVSVDDYERLLDTIIPTQSTIGGIS